MSEKKKGVIGPAIFCGAALSALWAVWQIPSIEQCGQPAWAWMVAQDEVRATLKAPDSASFPAITDASIRRTGECAFTVSAHVDAQNGFGAMLRQPFTVTIEYLPQADRYIARGLDL